MHESSSEKKTPNTAVHRLIWKVWMNGMLVRGWKAVTLSPDYHYLINWGDGSHKLPDNVISNPLTSVKKYTNNTSMLFLQMLRSVTRDLSWRLIQGTEIIRGVTSICCEYILNTMMEILVITNFDSSTHFLEVCHTCDCQYTWLDHKMYSVCYHHSITSRRGRFFSIIGWCEW